MRTAIIWLVAAGIGAAELITATSGAVAQQQMLPGNGGGLPGSANIGTSRSVSPQAQSIAPLYPPPTSPSMPIPMFTPGALRDLPNSGAQGSLALSARFNKDAPITSGLVWRIFPSRPDPNGSFRPLREDRNPNPVMQLPVGDYIVHVSCGLATMAHPVHVTHKDTTREMFELAAGGIKLEGRVGDVKIASSAISFEIYPGSQFEPGTKAAIAQVVTDDVVVVPEGSYYIVSNYGDTNALVRSDIRVQTGKLTEVTVNHRAALIGLKLVSEHGGDAIANTNWSISTPGGDVIKEANGIVPRIVLAEGDYHVVARNDSHTFQGDFKVVSGTDREVEVLATR